MATYNSRVRSVVDLQLNILATSASCVVYMILHLIDYHCFHLLVKKIRMNPLYLKCEKLNTISTGSLHILTVPQNLFQFDFGCCLAV